jgi:general secretion pathway protein F
MTTSAPELRFRYRGAHPDGRLERGKLVAASRKDAQRILIERGVQPFEVVQLEPSSWRRATIPVADLAVTLRILADMLDAGLPLARALHMLATVAPPHMANALPTVLAAVREGKGFVAALAQAEVRVPPEIAGIIRAGERGSGLARAVRDAAVLCDDSATTRAALRGALAYPMLLAVAGIASLGLLVGIVLPRFAAILGDLGQTLPLTTRIVLRVGDVGRATAIPATVIAIVGFVAWRQWTATTIGRRRWHAALLRIPVLGDLRLGAAGARLCASIAALLSSGVPLAAAIRSAAASTGDDEISHRILLARTDVEQGSRFSDALAKHGATTVFVQRLVRAGEESGRLASMLSHAAQLERDRVLRRLRAGVRLLEPAMIVGFGGVVALVAAALLQALYSIRPGS